MLVIIYVLLLVTIMYLNRNKTDEFKNSIILVFNYIVATLIHYYLNLSTITNQYDYFRLLLISIGKAPTYLALGFASNVNTENIQIFMISFIMYICTIRLVIALFFEKAYLYIRLYIRKFRCKEIIVVRGNESDAYAFIEDVHHKDSSIMMYYLSELTKQPIIEALLLKEEELEKVLSTNKVTVVLLPDQFNENILLLNRLNELGKKYKIKVTAYVANHILRHEDLTYPDIESYIISKESFLSQQLIMEYLPLKRLVETRTYSKEEYMIVPDHPYHCLMIGFSSLHQEFLLSIYENTAFKTKISKNGLNCIVVNDQGREIEDNFYQDYPALANDSSIFFESLNNQEIYQYIAQHSSDLDCILIDKTDTNLNIEIAMRILRIFKKQELKKHALLTVALYDPSNGAISLLAGEEDILFQQVNNKQYTYENLIDCKVEKQAHELNDIYNETSHNDIEWNHLSTFTKASNIAVILDLVNKDLLADDDSHLDQNELEKLCWQMARYEHSRWIHFHFAHGWTPLPVNELTEEEKSKFKTKRPGSKRHTCLIDFDELNSLPQQSEGLIQSYDYQNVLHFIKQKKEKQ